MGAGAGLVRIARGPTPADRMLAAQLFGTTGVAVLLLLAQGLENNLSRWTAVGFFIICLRIIILYPFGFLKNQLASIKFPFLKGPKF